MGALTFWLTQKNIFLYSWVFDIALGIHATWYVMLAMDKEQ